MKNFRLFACVSFLFFLAFGRSEAQNLELGIRFSGFNDFDFIFKKQIDKNRYLRQRIANLNLNVQGAVDSDVENIYNFGIRYALGWEKRKPLNDRLDFIHGLEPRLAFGARLREQSNSYLLSPGLGYVLGFIYNFNESFNIGIEAIPAVSLRLDLVENGVNSFNFNTVFNSNILAINLVYRFLRPSDEN